MNQSKSYTETINRPVQESFVHSMYQHYHKQFWKKIDERFIQSLRQSHDMRYPSGIRNQQKSHFSDTSVNSMNNILQALDFSREQPPSNKEKTAPFIASSQMKKKKGYGANEVAKQEIVAAKVIDKVKEKEKIEIKEKISEKQVKLIKQQKKIEQQKKQQAIIHKIQLPKVQIVQKIQQKITQKNKQIEEKIITKQSNEAKSIKMIPFSTKQQQIEKEQQSGSGQQLIDEEGDNPNYYNTIYGNQVIEQFQQEKKLQTKSWIKVVDKENGTEQKIFTSDIRHDIGKTDLVKFINQPAIEDVQVIKQQNEVQQKKQIQEKICLQQIQVQQNQKIEENKEYFSEEQPKSKAVQQEIIENQVSIENPKEQQIQIINKQQIIEIIQQSKAINAVQQPLLPQKSIIQNISNIDSFTQINFDNNVSVFPHTQNQQSENMKQFDQKNNQSNNLVEILKSKDSQHSIEKLNSFGEQPNQTDEPATIVNQGQNVEQRVDKLVQNLLEFIETDKYICEECEKVAQQNKRLREDNQFLINEKRYWTEESQKLNQKLIKERIEHQEKIKEYQLIMQSMVDKMEKWPFYAQNMPNGSQNQGIKRQNSQKIFKNQRQEQIVPPIAQHRYQYNSQAESQKNSSQQNQDQYQEDYGDDDQPQMQNQIEEDYQDDF